MHCLISTEENEEISEEENKKCLTLEKFEEASEKLLKQVTQETKLVYSDYLSATRPEIRFI